MSLPPSHHSNAVMSHKYHRKCHHIVGTSNAPPMEDLLACAIPNTVCHCWLIPCFRLLSTSSAAHLLHLIRPITPVLDRANLVPQPLPPLLSPALCFRFSSSLEYVGQSTEAHKLYLIPLTGHSFSLAFLILKNTRTAELILVLIGRQKHG